MVIQSNFDCDDCINYKSIIKRLHFFQDISQNILSKKPLHKLLDEIINTSKSLLHAEACSLLLYDKSDKLLHFHIVSGKKKKALTNKTVKPGEGLAGWTAKNKRVLKIDDCYKDQRFNREFDKRTGFKTRNMLCAPMIRKNELIGVIQVMNKKGRKHFTSQDVDLFTALCSECALAIENARLAEVEVKNEQINYELATARNIQQKLLPIKLPVFDDIDINVKLIPAKEVGGDYFNIIDIDDRRILFLVADVTGKSISAALIVSTIYSFMQTFLIINKENFNLKSLVESLNRFLVKSTTSDKFATAWFGLYDRQTKMLESINAGHNQTYIIKKNSSEIIELVQGGLFLGSIDLPYDVELFQLNLGDAVMFYTDGVTETMNTRGEEYGEERFKEFIISNCSGTCDNFIDNLLKNLKTFRGRAEQSDDITCGIIQVK